MKFLVWTLGLFAAATALTLAANNPGYVLLVYPPYRVELSLTLFVVLLLLVFAAAYVLLRLLILVMQLPRQVRRFKQGRAEAKSRLLLEEMLAAFFEGRYAAAEQAAARALENGEKSSLYPVIAARSAHELGNYKKRDAYLAQAEGRKLGDTTMRLMTASKFMLDQHDSSGALKALRELRDSGVRNHTGALSMELKAQQQSGNWGEVLKLIDQLERREAIGRTAAEQLRQHAWLEKIRGQQELPGLHACLKTIPDGIRRQGRVAAEAARTLIRLGDSVAACRLLSDSLNAQWDSELVALYGDCQSGDVLVQIEQAEKWLQLHQQDAGLLLALGKLCLHQKLWGKAQSYLDASLSIAPTREAYATLARLAERMGKGDEAARYAQMAMKLGSGE